MSIFNAILEKPRGVHFESKEPGEKVYYLLRRHPITNLGWILLSIFLTLLPPFLMILLANSQETIQEYFPANYQLVGLIIWYLATLFLTFESFLMWYFNVYIITSERVIDIDFAGLWTKRVSEATLDKVEDVTYETTNFFHILLDYGNIYMQTAAEQREFEFHSIPKPGKVHDVLTDLVQEYKEKNE